jgi:hypothetical protein
VLSAVGTACVVYVGTLWFVGVIIRVVMVGEGRFLNSSSDAGALWCGRA